MKLQTLNFIILTSAVVVFIGAGCGQTSKNKVTSSVNAGNQVGEVEGETAANLEEEAEETVPEESVEEIDTSDWLTYENEEYGFSFRYPNEWGETILERKEEKGSEFKENIFFKNDKQKYQKDGVFVPSVQIYSKGFEENYEGGDAPMIISSLSKVNFSGSENEIATQFELGPLDSGKVTILKEKFPGFKVVGLGKNLLGDFENIYYYFDINNYYLVITVGNANTKEVENLIYSIR